MIALFYYTRGQTMQATITKRNRVTIPIQLRKQLGLKPGDRFVYEVNDLGELVMRRDQTEIAKPDFEAPPATQPTSPPSN
jgi:AbrB family looped-hinge helix DNA binding protein